MRANQGILSRHSWIDTSSIVSSCIHISNTVEYHGQIPYKFADFSGAGASLKDVRSIGGLPTHTSHVICIVEKCARKGEGGLEIT